MLHLGKQIQNTIIMYSQIRKRGKQWNTIFTSIPSSRLTWQWHIPIFNPIFNRTAQTWNILFVLADPLLGSHKCWTIAIYTSCPGLTNKYVRGRDWLIRFHFGTTKKITTVPQQQRSHSVQLCFFLESLCTLAHWLTIADPWCTIKQEPRGVLLAVVLHPMTDPWLVYSPTWMVDFWWNMWVNIPYMDPIWAYSPKFFGRISAKKRTRTNYHLQWKKSSWWTNWWMWIQC